MRVDRHKFAFIGLTVLCEFCNTGNQIQSEFEGVANVYAEKNILSNVNANGYNEHL